MFPGTGSRHPWGRFCTFVRVIAFVVADKVGEDKGIIVVGWIQLCFFTKCIECCVARYEMEGCNVVVLSNGHPLLVFALLPKEGT